MPKTAPALKALKSRENEVDVLKGIGILFVIIGHQGSPLFGGNSILEYVYTFHMPLFFIVIGYLSINVSRYSFGTFFKKRVYGLLIPYLLFFLFSFLWTNTVYTASRGLPWGTFLVAPFDYIQAFVLAGGYLNEVPIHNFPLWFLPLCFAASIVFYLLIKIKNTKLLILATVAIALLTIPFQELLPGRPIWHINVLPAAVVFMLIGYFYNRLSKNLPQWQNSYSGLALIIVGFVLPVLFHTYGYISQINTLFYFLFATISTAGYYALAHENQSKFLQYIGRNSLWFFALHALVLIMLPILKIDEFFIARGQDGIVVYAIQIMSTVLLTAALVAIMKYATGKSLVLINRLRARGQE